MTDEEIQQAIQDVTESINNLSKADKPLPKEEARRGRVLLLKRETLKKIKEAREKDQKGEELHHTITYGLLTSWGEKHPYLMALVRSNIRWDGF